MKNAFIILGATPNDGAEKLRELYEEKQLFADDDKILNTAYTELTNVKKRIIHEIKYFSKDAFEEFDNIFIENEDDEQEMVIEDICSSIIKVGKWFDQETDNLYDKINEAREKSGFALIGDNEVISTAVNTLKDETIIAVKKYFDYWEQKDIVSLFNILVEQEDYMSFFIDDLLIHYENLISETIEKKANSCKTKFDLIKNNSDSFIENGLIDEDFSNNITSFKKALNAWDKLVQPLQVNYQKRGAQHPSSLDFVHSLRNSVIEMCNKSQEDLTGLLDKMQYDYSAKQTFVTKLGNSAEYIELLTKILDTLLQVFKEIDIVAERIKNDKKDFEKLKESIEELDNKIQPFKPRVSSNSWQNSSTTTKSNNLSSNKDPNYNTWEKVIKGLMGFTIIAAIIMMIVSFAKGFTIGGVLSIIVGIVAWIVASKWGSGDISHDTMKATSVILAIVMFIVSIVSIVNSQPPTGELNTSNFGRAFNTSFTSSTSQYYGGTLYYDISPKTDAYANNSSSSNTITIVVKYSFTGGSGYSQNVTITLYKSKGYKASGSTKITAKSFTYKNKSTSIVSVSGYVYK